MRAAAIITGWMLALAASATGCDDKSCIPAEQVACACPGGSDGAQVCLEDGSGFGACTGCAGSGGGGQGGGGQGGDGDGGATSSAGGGPVCGDGVATPPEECDGLDLRGETCATVLGAGATGELACWNICTFYTDACCVPDCAGKNCGPDGCGQTCGSCAGGESCTDGLCACVPDCGGKECGPDGCGGSCGQCSGNEACTNGQCTCVPDCSGKECGPNGCGGSCGSCVAPELCSGNGQCACTPSCAGKECGADGCGGSCGQCSGNETCESQQCTACVHACPSLEAVALPPNTSGCTPSGDCSICGGPACGALHYAYTCGGAPVGGVYPPPDIAGCQRATGYSNAYCCPVAACVRYQGWDASCQAATGLPVARFCHAEAPAPAGCQPYSGALCCPN